MDFKEEVSSRFTLRLCSPKARRITIYSASELMITPASLTAEYPASCQQKQL